MCVCELMSHKQRIARLKAISLYKMQLEQEKHTEIDIRAMIDAYLIKNYALSYNSRLDYLETVFSV